MIDINVGNDREDRLDDVGGVETSTHADFKDGDIDPGGGKEIEGHGGHGFKKAGQMGSAEAATSGAVAAVTRS